MEHGSDEIEKLKTEIAYLRQLLDAHGIPYRKEAEKTPCVAPMCSLHVTEDLARLFFSYFWGRPDVYSRRTLFRNGSTGYVPVCANAWKRGICPKCDKPKSPCGTCTRKNYRPIRAEVIISHLEGNEVVGIYPLFPSGTCHLLVFDFDNHESEEQKNWKADVDALGLMCRKHGIPHLVERSRSGNGAHLWIFFEKAIPAHKARTFGSALLTKGAESVSLQDFSTYDRMLPMQDELPKGKLGNLIALPWQKNALAKGNSAFVDAWWNPYPDQEKALVATRKLSEAFVDAKIKEWTKDGGELGILAPSSEKPWEPKEVHMHREDVEGHVAIVYANGLFIDKSTLKPRIQNQIRRLAAYRNPLFYRKQALGFSTYETPRIVSCGHDEEGYICLPRGCLDSLLAMLGHASIPYEIHDERQKGKRIKAYFKGTLYPEQQKAVDALLGHDTGVLSAATAFGKTVVGAYLVGKKMTNTLILVQSTEILENWKTSLEQYLALDEEPPLFTTPTGRVRRRKSVIGTICASQKAPGGIIDIAMIGSLGKEEIKSWVEDYGLVLMDECHHAGAFTAEQVLRKVRAKYVYGLTATPRREDGQDQKIFFQLGPIRYRYSAKERAESQEIGHFVVPRFTHLLCLDEKASLADLNKLVVASETRNQQILHDVVACVRKGRTPLVLTKYRAHAHWLYANLKDRADHVVLLEGGKTKKERDAIHAELMSVPRQESLVAVAIGKYIGEGFNFPRFDTLLLAMPISWSGNVEQYAGRINRDYEGRKEVLIFDYLDARVPMLERMYRKRLSVYRKMGYEVRTEIQDTPAPNRSLYDAQSCMPVLLQDVQSARMEIVFGCPTVDAKKVSSFLTLIAARQDQGIKICLMTASPDIEAFQKAGVTVIFRKHTTHFIVIDRKLCWYGKTHLLSQGFGDSLMRLSSPSIAAELLEETLGE